MPGDYNELDAFRGELPAPDGSNEPSPSYVVTTGSYANPQWITALAWAKITGTPTTLVGYGITDGGGTSNLTVGATTITGGTRGGVLYDNVGVVGELDATKPLAFALPNGSEIVFEGDSLFTSYGLSAGQDVPTYIGTYLGSGATVTNVATAGNGLADVVSQYSAQVYPRRPAATGALRAILALDIGSNDIALIAGGTHPTYASLSAWYTALASYVSTAVTDGFSVMLATLCPRTDYSYVVDTIRQQMNDLIRTNVDASIIDLGHRFPVAVSSDAFWLDGVHFTVVGRKKWARVICDSIIADGSEGPLQNFFPQGSTSYGAFRFPGPTHVSFPDTGVMVIGNGSVTRAGLDGNNGRFRLFPFSGSHVWNINAGFSDPAADVDLALPVVSGTLSTLAGTEALSNKTFNGNTITNGTGTLNLQTFTGTLTTTGNLVSTGDIGTVTDTMLANAVKPAVAVVAVSNVTLSGEQTIDGQLTSSSLVLCAGQSTGSQNGPWTSGSGAWTRPGWYTNGSTTQAPQFLTTFIRLGTTYQGSTWRMTTASVTIGTTATTWVQTPTNLSSITGTLAVANGGTNIASYAVGDIIYASGTTTLSKLADVATGSVLVSGGVATAPAWSSAPTFAGTNLTGTAASLTAGNATKWTTGRTIAMTGDVTYTSGGLDGSGNVTGTAALANIPAISGANLTGLNASNLGTGTAVVSVGGTGITSYIVGAILYASGTTTLSGLLDVATGSVLVSGGLTTAPAWSATPTFSGANLTGLNSANITASTTNALGIGTVELGNASDTTLSRSAPGTLAVEGVDVLTTSNTKTVTNKSIAAGQINSGSLPDAQNTVSNSTTTTMSALGTIGGVLTITGAASNSLAVIGGTATSNQVLELRSSAGNSTSGDAIKFTGKNTGATEFGRFSYGSNGGTELLVGTTSLFNAANYNLIRLNAPTSGTAEIHMLVNNVLSGIFGATSSIFYLYNPSVNPIGFYTGASAVQQVRVTHTASATRTVDLTGSNGGNPTISASAGSLNVGSALIASSTLAVTGASTLTGLATVNSAVNAAHVGGTIFTDFGTTSTTHTDGTEDDLYTHTTVASSLGANGDSIEQVEHISFVSSATAARRVKKYFGGTLIFDSGALTLTLGGEFSIYTIVIRESSSIVRCDVSVTSTSASTLPYSTYTRITGLTLSSTNIVKTTGIASGTGALSGDIANTLSRIAWNPA